MCITLASTGGRGRIILRRPDETGLGILLTAYTGIRLGELCGLKWQDVNVDTGMLHVQRTVERIAQEDGTTCLTVQTPKTDNSNRWIPIPQEMLRVLKGDHRPPDAYLLTGGEIMPDPRTYQYRYKALLKRCGVCYRNFHALRHTYATRCIEQGIDAKSVSELLGHSDVRTTLRLYVHSSMDYKRKAVEETAYDFEAHVAEKIRLGQLLAAHGDGHLIGCLVGLAVVLQRLVVQIDGMAAAAAGTGVGSPAIVVESLAGSGRLCGRNIDFDGAVG